MPNEIILKEFLSAHKQEDYPLHSRAHVLKIGQEFGIDCYVKREDELGCLLSGSKVRKYRTIIKALKKRNCRKAGLIGSQFSNHVLGLSSLLIENDIEPTLFLLKSKQPDRIGNALYIELLVADKNIHFIERNQWSSVEKIANQWQIDNSLFNAQIIPEGGLIADSVAGLATLALDILENEHQLNLQFKDILIDAGSGLTAASLIAVYGLLNKDTNIHVMLSASTPEEFAITVEKTKIELELLTKESIPKLPRFFLHRPPSAPSFGSTNAKIFQTIAAAARKEGFLLEPIYSAKLYLLLEELLQSKLIQSPALFIHSGGLLTLSGFQSELRRNYD